MISDPFSRFGNPCSGPGVAGALVEAVRVEIKTGLKAEVVVVLFTTALLLFLVVMLVETRLFWCCLRRVQFPVWVRSEAARKVGLVTSKSANCRLSPFGVTGV